jgi:glycerate 2-kinase
MRAPDFGQHRVRVEEVVSAVLRAGDPRRLVGAGAGKFPPRIAGAPVIAIGKAAPAMYGGFVARCGEPRRRLMIIPDGVPGPQWALRGEHPVPGEHSVSAAAALREFVRGPGNTAFVLLLSGGASALTALPAPGLTLADLREVTDGLLRAGAGIRELNCVRKHLEQLKGGRLAALMAPAPVDMYVLSDVIGDDLGTVGSGPAWPDPTSFADALAIVRGRGLGPESVTRFLEDGVAGKHPETPKPGDAVFLAVRTTIVGNNTTVTNGAKVAAELIGLSTEVLPRKMTGEAAAEGAAFAGALPPQGPACLIAGGETTVDVGGAHGRGGRNQELALAAAIAIDGREGAVVASFATDGVDGPTDAAGAMVTGRTCRIARQHGLDPRRALADHDSFGFFEALEAAGERCLIRTGPTGTNLNDVTIGLVF